MAYKVVITDYVFPDLEIERKELAKIDATLVECAATDEESIIKEAKDADAVLVCYAELTDRIVSSLDKCRVISRYGIGVNNIDVPVATEKGIAVTFVPDYCVEEVSDHALTLILACTRKLCQLNSTVKNGTWDYKGQRPIYRLRGRTLGLVGFGKIPRRLAEKVQAFGFELLAYDPYANRDSVAKTGVTLVELNELLAESDIISVHAPLTEETNGMLGYEQFKMMKKAPVVVNTARGPLVKQADLLRALQEGLVSSAGLDVLESEDFDPNNPLVALDNVVLTPHVAFYSEESLKELQFRAVEGVVKVLTGEEPRACLNPEVLARGGR